ncbi:hypothetical protein AXG93_4698s1260 [Marchantia polymorpha subsp. ruderalis]|uniref:Uncharacterized protein n=1 Tax=Marchantia polymorpha subsp. ruderalis TaxID=1480154 RepID=A0A176VL31_MARPO|nr:hypothetical protein AXG93_4698s1260 [Marchantia polymorpha subsp. ruderalis]
MNSEEIKSAHEQALAKSEVIDDPPPPPAKRPSTAAAPGVRSHPAGRGNAGKWTIGRSSLKNLDLDIYNRTAFIEEFVGSRLSS